MLVTDRSLFGRLSELEAAVRGAVEGGVNVVQLREKDLPDAEQLALARRLRAITAGRALLFVNDSVSVAVASDADGVQLGEASRNVADARARAQDAPLLFGRSVHDLVGATSAASQGADLLIARHDAGASGVAAIRGILGLGDPRVAAEQLCGTVERAWAGRGRS